MSKCLSGIFPSIWDYKYDRDSFDPYILRHWFNLYLHLLYHKISGSKLTGGISKLNHVTHPIFMTLVKGSYLIQFYTPISLSLTISSGQFWSYILGSEFNFSHHHLNLKYWDQNCPVNIIRLNWVESSNIHETFWGLYLSHSFAPLSLSLRIRPGQFLTYFLRS